MKMHPVQSSHITHIGYDNGELHVTYKGGKTYTFSGCTSRQFDELMQAESKGKHLRTMTLTQTN